MVSLSIKSSSTTGFKDNFFNITLNNYVKEIVNSFKEISDKNFIINTEQNYNSFEISKLIEVIYGIRNFVGNANKFAKKRIYISIKSDNQFTEISIEDDGNGYSKDVLNKIGEPYIKSSSYDDKSKSGLGLGIFIGKTLLERNGAKVICRNSKTRSGAEVLLTWKNKDLKNL